MEIYESVTQYLSTFPVFKEWSQMKSILNRMASKKPRDWQLPVIACQSLGRPDEDALPASAALACAQISIILVDDMLDDDPRGEYRRIGDGRAANFALAFQALGMDAILGSRASLKVRKEAAGSLHRMMSTTALGQDLDIQNPADEESYWRVVENKSAPFYGCALHLGALFGEASDEVASGLEQFGRLYGAMVQIHDDLNDTMAVPANPDWIQGRKPLPILFAQSVDHPDHARFMELYQNISEEGALEEAQGILIRCGAVSYCVDQLIRRHRAAQDILNKTPLHNKGTVDSLIEAVIAPVWRLFETLGVSTTFAEAMNRE